MEAAAQVRWPTLHTSLLEEWECLLHPEIRLAHQQEHAAIEAIWVTELLKEPKVFAARVRAEMHLVVRALAHRDWEEAAAAVRPDPEGPWDADRFEASLAPFFAEYGDLVFTPEARRHQWTQIRPTGDRKWEVFQTLLDPPGRQPLGGAGDH